MPVELSYPGLKCVLEFLEANKRIHISSRCPRLKHIERFLPLYLNTLTFLPNAVKLNKMMYEIDEREEETTNHPDIDSSDGDILIGPGSPVFNRGHPIIQFWNGVNTFVERRVQENDTDEIKYCLVIRTVIQRLMGGRNDVRVDQLVFERCDSTILRLPSNFIVRINKLDSGVINPEYFLPLIDTSSFPLKELRLRFPGTLDQPIVQSSEKLVIFVTEQYFRDFLVDILILPNRIVFIECLSLDEDTCTNIIHYWLSKKQETGKCLMIIGREIKIMENAIDLMKKYNGKMVKWNGTEFSSSPDTNYISIPLNDDLVIAIYAVTHESWSHQIVMKTMPIDTFIPAEDFSEAKTLLEIKALKKSRQNDEAMNPSLVVCFVLLLLLLAIVFFTEYSF
ncbi:hypothetical protein CRE_22642 [Caenorhabditis remanei]|uniref:Uncharacterized protein n=1 Tax=Caenorhabditis remanei TaxID=31234 RepID=E3N8Q4_CAERE|nr:hypothetical protein CRE_22642 [Caenorhabditis remanei]